MKKLLLLLIATLMSFFIFSCEENPVEEKPKELKPGRNDYVWEVDTLDIFNVNMYCLYGETPDDIWAGGGSFITGDPYFFHYEGEKWKPYPLETSNAFTKFYGVNSNDIWVAGGRIAYHFDGENWNETKLPNTNDINKEYIIYQISGDEAGNIFGVGSMFITNPETLETEYHARIISYKNGRWIDISPDTLNRQFSQIEFSNKHNRFYIRFGNEPAIVNENGIYEFDGNKLTEIYKSSGENYTYSSFGKVGDEVIFSIGQVLYTREKEKFVEFLDMSGYQFNGGLDGRHRKDVFIRLRRGLMHWNGSEFKLLFPFRNFTDVESIVQFDNSVFVLVKDYVEGTNTIHRGYLQTEKEADF